MFKILAPIKKMFSPVKKHYKKTMFGGFGIIGCVFAYDVYEYGLDQAIQNSSHRIESIYSSTKGFVKDSVDKW